MGKLSGLGSREMNGQAREGERDGSQSTDYRFAISDADFSPFARVAVILNGATLQRSERSLRGQAFNP